MESPEQLDKRHLWHPFTPMGPWCAEEHTPLILAEGRGCTLRDPFGNEYLDGNASIWTNVHGHNHPVINAAIVEQLGKVAHTSFLGFTHEPAIRLAKGLVDLLPGEKLTRAFFTDNGSTAIESAVRMALQYWKQNGRPQRDTLVAFDRAYHGDTLGAASLGQKAYDVGEFERALTLYSEAYKLKTLPGFLFNIAQCHRQLGNFERASFFFGRFIDNSKPAAPNVELARELMTDMERRQAEKAAAEKKAADEKAQAEADAKLKRDAPIAPPLTPVEVVSLPPPLPAVEPEPVTKQAWFWVVIGGAVVAVAGGITAGVLLSQPREVMYVPRMTSLPDIDGRR
jgi:hypothetical protein